MLKPRTYFEQVPLETVRNILLREVVLFVQDNARRWDDAAHCLDDLAPNLSDQEKAKWELVAACYQERAQLHRNLVGKVQAFVR